MDWKDREAIELLEVLENVHKEAHPHIAEAARRGAKAIEIKYKLELLIAEYEGYTNG